MPSLLPDYEYDVFVSYRQKDNKGEHWVSEFVRSLKTELEATFKEDVSIYFDENPRDGLLETHNVDKSLEGKLKCLVFIPIISQTYCDPRSFAWQHELCAFNRMAKESPVGRDIKLIHGNVASRILPVKIHDLDVDDKAALEGELGGALRPIEFIYKEPGVNRPLKPDDHEETNLNKTKYRNQINKVANAVKEIISGMQGHEHHEPVGRRSAPNHSTASLPSKSNTSRIVLWSILAVVLLIAVYFFFGKQRRAGAGTESNSIAVLPFKDMSAARDQEYLGDGVAEEILNVLSSIKGLKVVGRTSSFSFKGKDTDLRTIGELLGVKTILEGSVRKSGNQIRITAQLINAEDASHIWSETFNSELKDILAIEDEIAAKIGQKLRLSLLQDHTDSKVLNPEAYEMVLKGNLNFNKGPEGFQSAVDDYTKAISLDSLYGYPYILRGWAILNQTSFYIFSPREGYAKATADLQKGLHLSTTSAEYYLAHTYLAVVHLWGYEWKEAWEEHEKSLVISPKPDAFSAFSLALVYGKTSDAVSTMEKIVEEDPVNVYTLMNLVMLLHWNRQDAEALKICNKVLDLNPSYSGAYFAKAFIYRGEGKYDLALENSQKASQYGNPAATAQRLEIDAYLGKKDEVRKTMAEIESGRNATKVSPGQKASIYFSLGDRDLGFEWLNRAYEEREFSVIALKVAPEMDLIRSDPRFKQLLKKMDFPE